MPMNIKSDTPFGVPIVGSAKLIACVDIVTLECSCKNILMGQMGVVIPCIKCNKAWYVSAESRIKIQEILADINENSNNPFERVGN